MANQRGRRPSKAASSSSKRRFQETSSLDPKRAAKLRIIAGTHRGRTLTYRGDPTTRPMKDRTREALFSRLGGLFDNGVAIDLFAGTGILGLETLSRGAKQAWMIELDTKAAADIRTSAKQLGFDPICQIRCGDTFILADLIIEQILAQTTNDSPRQPWFVYVCPPYALWDHQGNELHDLVQKFCRAAPVGSLITVELEAKTPSSFLPSQYEWDNRLYHPAQVAIAEIMPLAESSATPE